jgi:hypothetical protein
MPRGTSTYGTCFATGEVPVGPWNRIVSHLIPIELMGIGGAHSCGGNTL